MTLQDTLQNGTKPGLNLDRLGLGLLALVIARVISSSCCIRAWCHRRAKCSPDQKLVGKFGDWMPIRRTTLGP